MQTPALELGSDASLALRRAKHFALLDFAANQAAWWCAILLVESGHALFAASGPAAYVLVHLLARPEVRSLVARLAVTGALVGLVGDTLVVRAGLMTFPSAATDAAWSPPFMVSLWAMFAVSLSASARFLSHLKVYWAAALGAMMGPVAYFGGERLGVLELEPWASPVIALEWAVAVAILATTERRGRA
jgi:hypothetical protein